MIVKKVLKCSNFICKPSAVFYNHIRRICSVKSWNYQPHQCIAINQKSMYNSLNLNLRIWSVLFSYRIEIKDLPIENRILLLVIADDLPIFALAVLEIWQQPLLVTLRVLVKLVTCLSLSTVHALVPRNYRVESTVLQNSARFRVSEFDHVTALQSVLFY